MPNDFIAHTFPGLMAHRRPRYAALAGQGASPCLERTNAVRSDTGAAFDLIAEAIDRGTVKQ